MLTGLGDEILAYMYNLLIPLIAVNDGLWRLEHVLSLIVAVRLKLNLVKYFFLKTQIEYSDYEVSRGDVRY